MFKNLVTLVTGGASGLGKATAERFIKKGSKVVICDLHSSHGEGLAKELGDDAIFIPTDVTSTDDVTTALNVIKEKYKKLDVLVNCAGIAHSGLTSDPDHTAPHDLGDFEKVINVNLKGTFNTIRLAYELISQNEEDEDGGRGVIINTSGLYSTEGDCGEVAMAAACGAIDAITLPLAREFGGRGVRVVTISPGLFDTPFIKFYPDKYLNFIQEDVVFPKRLGHPDEYAFLVQTIVTNKYLNATTIRLDGGTRIPN